MHVWVSENFFSDPLPTFHTGNMPDPVSAYLIGLSFVKYYYECLSGNPSDLASSYAESCTVVHNRYTDFLVDEDQRLVEVTASTRAEVSEKIYGGMSPEDQYKVMVTQVDCVDLHLGGPKKNILIAVLGEIAKGDSPAFPFSQTFQISETNPGVYDLVVDVFRFVLTGEEKAAIESLEKASDKTSVAAETSETASTTPLSSVLGISGKEEETKKEEGEEEAKEEAKEEVKEDVKETQEEKKEKTQEETKNETKGEAKNETKDEPKKDESKKEVKEKESEKKQEPKSWAATAAMNAPRKKPQQKSAQKPQGKGQSKPQPKPLHKPVSKAGPQKNDQDGFDVVKPRGRKNVYPVLIRLNRTNVDALTLHKELDKRFGNVNKCDVKDKTALVDFRTAASHQKSLQAGMFRFGDVEAQIENRPGMPRRPQNRPKKFVPPSKA